ncbi:MAG: DUF4369 domain-containing protein [Pedobacter sp.]|nr:MAG: DUF4369 domain-containing protein [Pedobacter sp.]
MTLFSKHGLHSFAFFLIGLLCFKANAQKPFEVHGKIANLPDGTVITFMKNEGNLLTTVANDTVKAGAFKFSGTIDELTEYGITGNGDGFPSTWLELYLKPGSKVSITGSDKLLRTWKVNSNVAEQQDLAQFTAASEKQTNQLQALTAQEYPLFEQLQTASKEQRSLIKRSIDSLRCNCDI